MNTCYRGVKKHSNDWHSVTDRESCCAMSLACPTWGAILAVRLSRRENSVISENALQYLIVLHNSIILGTFSCTCGLSAPKSQIWPVAWSVSTICGIWWQTCQVYSFHHTSVTAYWPQLFYLKPVTTWECLELLYWL